MLRAPGLADGVSFFDSPIQAWTGAQTLMRDGKSAALDYRFIGDERAASDATARLDALADVAQAGQVLASKALAFALLAEAREVRVEPIGEIRAAGGFFPVYALA